MRTVLDSKSASELAEAGKAYARTPEFARMMEGSMLTDTTLEMVPPPQYAGVLERKVEYRRVTRGYYG